MTPLADCIICLLIPMIDFECIICFDKVNRVALVVKNGMMNKIGVAKHDKDITNDAKIKAKSSF